MIRKIRRTPQARRDIIAIFTYLYQRSPTAAEAVFEAIEQTIRSLAMFPNVGNRWVSDLPRLDGIRYTPVTGYRNFIVPFKTDGRTVRLLRVVHGARDLEEVIREIE
jgi:toxin ParE1/3/4